MTECPYCELVHTPDLARSLLTAADAADLLGFEADSQGRIQSFEQEGHHRNNLALTRDDGGWHDFYTGEGGDVIDFVMKVTGCSFNKAMNVIIHKSLKAGREPGHVAPAQPREVIDFTDELSQHGYVYGCPAFAGLNPPASCRFDYENGQLLIPHADQDGVYGVKVRGTDGSKAAWPGSQFTKRLYDPWGWHRPNETDRVVICEGESDCWALDTVLEWATVLALPSGASAWKDHWLEDLEPFQTVWLCFDNDTAGKAARDKLTSKIGWLKVKQLLVPQLYNDAREAIAAGWKPAL